MAGQGNRTRTPSSAPTGAPPRKLTTSAVDRGRALVDFLADRLALDPALAETLVTSGAVYLGRHRIENPSHVLDAHHRLTVYLAPRTAPTPAPTTPASLTASADTSVPDALSSPASSSPASSSPTGPVIDWVAYQDEDVIVIDKPAGVACQATRAASAGALDRRVADAIDPSARLLHRIDRDASGLVLFTRTTEARRRFAGFLSAYQLERTYCAAVWGQWQNAEGALSGSIGRDPRDHRRMAVGPGRPALTRFRLIRRGTAATGAQVSLLQLELVTGRTHQIRVHLADAGHPICGDALYGSDRPPMDRLYLHAHLLAWPGAAPVLAPVPSALSDLVG